MHPRIPRDLRRPIRPHERKQIPQPGEEIHSGFRLEFLLGFHGEGWLLALGSWLLAFLGRPIFLDIQK
jgi:hypothetical protein